MKEILIPLNFTTTPTVYDTQQSFSTSDESSGVLTFSTNQDVSGSVANLTIRNVSENANRQTVLVERLDVNSAPFSYSFDTLLPFGFYEGEILLKKNLVTFASARFRFGINSSLSAEVLPKLVEAYALDELVQTVETEVSNLKDAFTVTVAETVKSVVKTDATLQASENVRYLAEATRKADELLRKTQENARVEAELNRVETFADLVDSEMIAQTIETKLTEKEATFAPRILSVEQQLEQAELNKVDKDGSGQVGWANIAQDARLQIIGTTPPAVVGDNAVITSNLTDNAVTPIKTNFMRDSINLNKGLVNDLGINTSGTNFAATGGYASGYYELTETNVYSLKNSRIAYYDVSHAFISADNTSTGSTLKKLVPPVNAVYFRFSVSAADITTAFIAQSSEDIPFLEYNRKLSYEYFDENEFFKRYFKASKNLYDNVTVNNYDLNPSGTFYALSGYYASDYYEITGLIYNYKIRRIAFYDTNKTLISVRYGDPIMTSVPIPLNAVYFKFSVPPADILTAFICQSAVEIFEPEYNAKVKSEKIDVNSIVSSEGFVKSLTSGINSILLADVVLNIACYGDSLTEGAGSTNAGVYSYPTRLSGLIANANTGYTVGNRGVGGEDTNRIMIRQGSFADYVNPFTIPADTSATVITKSTQAGATIGGNTTIKNGVNPVTIGGIEGTLAFDGTNFTFSRSVAGTAVTLTHKTPLLRYSAQSDKRKILIAFMGQNGGYNDTADLIALYRRMIEYNGNSKFIIIGLTSGTTETRTTMETAMERAFGSNFINMREYLVNYGLMDNGLTATTQDNADIAVGTVPTQIRSDSVHMNNYGYFAIANAVYARGQALGYWL